MVGCVRNRGVSWAYLSQLCPSSLDSEFMCCSFTLKWCHHPVLTMLHMCVTCMLHDACMCIITWHHPNILYSLLGTLRNSLQANWQPMFIPIPSPSSQKWASPQVDQLISNANISMRKRARGFKFGQEREDRALFHFGSRPEQAICHCRSKRGGASASPRLRLAKAAPNRGACLVAHARPAHALGVPP